jgi:tRNA(Arg) A34 adenosine deaminase TadA
LFHKDSLNKAKVPENLKLANRAQHYDKSFHRRVMKKALQAEMAFDKGEIPVGAIVVNDSDR